MNELKVSLNVPDRIALLNVLPAQGSVTTLRIIRELQGKLGFSESELKGYQIKNNQNPDGSAYITWDQKKGAEAKEIEMGEAAMGIIRDQLKRLDSQGALHISMLPLYEKFVEKSP